MFCLGLAMTLRPGAHDRLWPELAAGMSASGVSMVLYRDGDRLFLFATAPSEAHWQRSRRDPVLARWDAAMTEFLTTDAAGRIAFTELRKVFGFGAFSDEKPYL